MEREAARPRAVVKSATAFRTISEVSEELEVPQHVLRFWETKFPQVRPLKRGGGRRYYRPEDVALLRKIQRLLYSEGYTIKGVQRLLKDQRGAGTEDDAESLVEDLLDGDLEAPDAEAEAEAEAEDAPDPAEPEPPVAPPLAAPDAVALPPVAQVTTVVPPMAPSVGSASSAVAAASSTAPAGAEPASPDLPAWLRRELSAIRADLVDMRASLRKVVR